jgi:hypothetical protein
VQLGAKTLAEGLPRNATTLRGIFDETSGMEVGQAENQRLGQPFVDLTP